MLSRVHALDLRIDAWVERVRSPQLDPVFYGLSSAADHGLLWLLVGATRAARTGDPGIALRMGAALGVKSALTNGPIKTMFRRVRSPTACTARSLARSRRATPPPRSPPPRSWPVVPPPRRGSRSRAWWQP